MKKNQKDILLQDWLDTWYEIYAKPFVKKSTLVSYECYIRLHIKPYIGNIKLCDFNTMTFQRFFAMMFSPFFRYLEISMVCIVAYLPQFIPRFIPAQVLTR